MSFVARFVVLTLVVGWVSPADAQSLWQQRKPSQAFLFYDTQARYVGDLLTVIVSENTDVDNKEQRSLGKETDTSTNVGLLHSVKGIFGTSSGALNESSQTASSRNFDGNAEFSSERLFSDRITVTVTDVLPNGDLVISGRRKINVAGDQRCLVISGIVRWQDVPAGQYDHVPLRRQSADGLRRQGRRVAFHEARLAGASNELGLAVLRGRRKLR